MKNIRIKYINRRVAALIGAGIMLISTGATLSGCKKNANDSSSNSITMEENLVDSTNKKIKSLFPTMNDEIINNTSLILLLDTLAKEDANGKIDASIISNFKSRMDTDNMINEFNAFIDELENTMITGNAVISTNDLLSESDSKILSNIESITSNILNLVNSGATKDQVHAEFNKIYSLFVNEDDIDMNGTKFNVRDLSYSARAIASAYARVSAYYARSYITKEEKNLIDKRTNDQNSKAYIKTKLEILRNQMNETSTIDVVSAFDSKYNSVNKLVSGKLNLSQDNIKNIVNYLNLKYLASDKVSIKDKNQVLGEYDDNKVNDTILSIDSIQNYNINNQNKMIAYSDLLIDEYAKTDTGKIDKIALNFVEYNSIMLLNTIDQTSDFSTIYNNPYFQNIYKYFTKQNFTHSYKENGELVEVNVNFSEISDSTNLINNEIILYTLNKLPKVDYMNQYIEKSQANLTESIQYLQNTITGECQKTDAKQFVK